MVIIVIECMEFRVIFGRDGAEVQFRTSFSITGFWKYIGFELYPEVLIHDIESLSGTIDPCTEIQCIAKIVIPIIGRGAKTY